MTCPKCGKSTSWHQLGSGGDGLEMCDHCDWVEPTGIDKSVKETN